MNKEFTKSKQIICFFLFFSVFMIANAERFTFKYNEGDSYRVLSSVHENVYFNGLFSHHAEIVNRISVKVGAVDDEWAEHDTVFMISESSSDRSGNPVFTWGEEYRSIFKRNKFGKYDIGDEYFMPVVRDVPIFPDKDLKPGDTWTASGEEAHDLRRGFALETPFKVPIRVQYTYVGPESINGKILHKILAKYTMNFINKQRPVDLTIDYPYITLGFANQTIYWNLENGAIEFYDEEFRIVIETVSGMTSVFEGTAHAEIADLIRVKPEIVVSEVQNQLKDLGIDNTNVVATEKGITISIENIQFKADSAVLEESEKRKLEKIAKILAMYPDNDLLVSGHTALAGSVYSRQQLSEQRAQAVASYLIELGVKDAYHIFSKGFGAEQPIAENSTEAGRSRNRRVEITILN
ncbi:MAG: OmpA family protein [Treponema sp.]|jgi:outer membrane protein OmpA-like peptidoglycan-associated protein|nr:OmpA family protein [Treponema sp.]